MGKARISAVIRQTGTSYVITVSPLIKHFGFNCGDAVIIEVEKLEGGIEGKPKKKAD